MRLALVYLFEFAVLVGVGWFVIPRTDSQISELADAPPHYAERYDRLREAYDDLAEEYPALGTLVRVIARLEGRG